MTEVLNKKIIRELRDTLQRCLDYKLSEIASWVEDRYDINVGNASFDNYEVTFKLTLRAKDVESKESMDLNRFAYLYDVVPQKVADVHGIKYKLVGYRVKARTKPFIVLNLQNNQEYVFTEDMGKRFFGKGEVACEQF